MTEAWPASREKAGFLLSVRTSVLGHFGITVFGGQGALVRVEHVFSLCDVGHLVGEVIHRRVPRLADFMPEPRASPGVGKGRVSGKGSKAP